MSRMAQNSEASITIGRLIPAGSRLARPLLERASTVSLDWDIRQKSRFDARDMQGRMLAVFLPRGTTVRDGDVLVCEDGSLVRVSASPQPVMVVRPGRSQGASFDLVRAAYHLGNRHVALELRPDHLKLEPDHVLADMLRKMGLQVDDALLPFEPEAGAYAASAHSHRHDGHDPHHPPHS
jgi:urease accessory protein